MQEILVLCIGLGVGVAAVIGTMRFIFEWPLKPLIYITMAPTVGCACYMQASRQGRVRLPKRKAARQPAGGMRLHAHCPAI